MQIDVIATPGMYNNLAVIFLKRLGEVTYTQVEKTTHAVDVTHYIRPDSDYVYFLGLRVYTSQIQLLRTRLSEQGYVNPVYVQSHALEQSETLEQYTFVRLGEEVDPLNVFAKTQLGGRILTNMERDILHATTHMYMPREARLADAEGKHLSDSLKLCMDVYGRYMGELTEFKKAETLQMFFESPDIALFLRARLEGRNSQLKQILANAIVREINGALVAVVYTSYRQKEVADYFIDNAEKHGYSQVAVFTHNFTKGSDMYYINTWGLDAKELSAIFGGKPWGSDSFATAFAGNTRELTSEVIFELVKENT